MFFSPLTFTHRMLSPKYVLVSSPFLPTLSNQNKTIGIGTQNIGFLFTPILASHLQKPAQPAQVKAKSMSLLCLWVNGFHLVVLPLQPQVQPFKVQKIENHVDGNAVRISLCRNKQDVVNKVKLIMTNILRNFCCSVCVCVCADLR